MQRLNNRKSSLLNSVSSVLSQFVSAILGIYSRRVFLTYLGVELLGLSSTFTSIITIASLAETGLGTCIIYRLYDALQNEDEEDINELLNVARLFFSFIGFGIIIVAVLFSPFLKVVITGIQVNFKVYIYFYLQVLSTASSYFLAYKRLLLTADKRDFVAKFTDTGTNILFSILKIITCVYLKNFIVYLIFSWMQVVLSNIILHISCQKIYPYLRYDRGNKERLRELWPDMKNLFWGGVSAYLFTAADNLILSIGVNTVLVGYLGNYTMVTSTLKSFILNLVLFMGPVIGNEVAASNESNKKVNDYLRLYDFALYFISTMIIIPEFVLLQDFVSKICGPQYLLSNLIVVLIVMDQYITIVQDSNGVFLSATGKFRELRIADTCAAISNIALSIIFCKFWGLAGVLFGTVVSRILQWIFKAYYTRNNSMLRIDNRLGRYIVRSLVKMICFCIIAAIEYNVYKMIVIDIFGVKFVLSGIVCVGISLVIISLVFLYNGDTQLAFCLIRKKRVLKCK